MSKNSLWWIIGAAVVIYLVVIRWDVFNIGGKLQQQVEAGPQGGPV